MKRLLSLLLLCSFNAGCQSTGEEDSPDLGALIEMFGFFSELGDCLYDDEESTPDEPGWITPAHPKD